jgi:hypothetical protein
VPSLIKMIEVFTKWCYYPFVYVADIPKEFNESCFLYITNQ